MAHKPLEISLSVENSGFLPRMNVIIAYIIHSGVGKGKELLLGERRLIMGFGIRLKVWGEYACFTRPEIKVERVSYDVITPSAARGILEAIYWKPSIKWRIDRIHVLNAIRFDTIRRNEVAGKISASKVKQCINGRSVDLHQYSCDGKERQMRASLVLRDVAYVLEAHFELIQPMDGQENEGKHCDIFRRRAQKGQCFMQPYLGCREFPAYFELLEGQIPSSVLKEERDLGWMLWDLDFENDMQPIFFRPTIKNGVIDARREVIG